MVDTKNWNGIEISRKHCFVFMEKNEPFCIIEADKYEIALQKGYDYFCRDSELLSKFRSIKKWYEDLLIE